VKERRRITEVIVKQSAEICSIIPNENGSLSLIDTDGKPVEHELHQSVGYLRGSGKPKLLRSIVRKRDDRLGDNPWKKYDKIGFVDTNSLKEGSRRLFVCSPSLLLWQDESRRMGDVHPVDLFIGYCSDQLNPERLGWCDFIQRMQASDLLNETDQILLVVDSEMAAIPAINGRTRPISGDFLLPEGFTVAYATSDAGTESWVNREMKRRDKVAARAMAKIQGDQGLLDALGKSGTLYIKNIFE
jgi:hypothetical protein